MLVLFFFLLTLELILFKISMSKILSHLGDQMESLTLIYKNKNNFERIWWVTLRLLAIRLIESKSSKGTIPLIRSINVSWCWSATTDQIESMSMLNDESRWTLDGSSWYKSGLRFFICSTVGNSSMRYFIRDLFSRKQKKKLSRWILHH